jgi:hypothetical protein
VCCSRIEVGFRRSTIKLFMQRAHGTGYKIGPATRARRRGDRGPGPAVFSSRQRVCVVVRVVSQGNHRAGSAVAPELVPLFETLIKAHHDILARIAELDGRIRAVAKEHATVRPPMTAPASDWSLPWGACRLSTTLPGSDAPPAREPTSGSHPDDMKPARSAEMTVPQSAAMASPENACSRPRMPSTAETSAAHACATGPRASPRRPGLVSLSC